MSGYDGPNNRRYEKKKWIGARVLGAALLLMLGWLGMRKRQ
jgi:hypothetical protein